MQGKTLLQQLEEQGLNILPMLEGVEDAEVRHAVREFVSTVQAVRILSEDDKYRQCADLPSQTQPVSCAAEDVARPNKEAA